MDAIIVLGYLMSNAFIESKDLIINGDFSSLNEPIESLRRNMLSCTKCGVSPCLSLKYECNGTCQNISCDQITTHLPVGVYIGIIIAIFFVWFIISLFVYRWAKGNAKRRILLGPMSGVIDEGTEFCLVLLIGFLLGGVIGMCFFLCALSCGRSSGKSQGEKIAESGTQL